MICCGVLLILVRRALQEKPTKYPSTYTISQERMRSWARNIWGASKRSCFPSRPGYDALWLWFGLSRASFLTLPRVLLHEMPDDWQAQMAKLLNEWDDYWDVDKMFPSGTHFSYQVNLRRGSRNISMPLWILNYRHPNHEMLEGFKAK